MRILTRLAPLLAVLLLVAACGRGTEPAATADGGTEAEHAAGAENEASGSDGAPEPVAVRYYVTDEGLYGLIEKRTTVEPAGPGDLYRLAIEALKLEDEAAGEYSLWKNAEFNRVELSDGVLTVDLSLPDEARFGSMGEALALEAIARTAFQFDEVEALARAGRQPDGARSSRPSDSAGRLSDRSGIRNIAGRSGTVVIAPRTGSPGRSAG